MKNKVNNNKKSFDLIATIVSHRRIATIILVVLYIVLTFVICRFVPTGDSEVWFSLNRIELSAEISSFFFIVVSSIIAVWQYYISCRYEHAKDEKENIQKSIELMEYYKDNVLNKISAIELIFKYSGIADILDEIDKTKIKDFDSYEVDLLLSSSKINELKKIEDSEKFIIAIIMANNVHNLNLPEVNNCVEKTDTSVSVNQLKIYNAFMSSYISRTLNNLEFFAMHFSHNIADESVIYQSAHQTYIKIAELLYYNIAKQNTPGRTKYYTNLIELYNTWKKKQLNQRDSIAQGHRCSVEKGTEATCVTKI